MSSPSGLRPPEDGLQPERTALAWSRTAFGVLGNGVLLLWHDLGHGGGPPRLYGAGLAAVIAVLTYVVGWRRQRMLSRRPLPIPLAPRSAVRLIGVSVGMLIVVTVLALPL